METANNWIERELYGGPVLVRGYANIYLPCAKDKNITLVYGTRKIGQFETVEKAQRKADLIEAVISNEQKISLEFAWEGHNLLCNGYPVAQIEQANGKDLYFWSYKIGGLSYGPHEKQEIKEIVRDYVLEAISPWAAILLGFEVKPE